MDYKTTDLFNDIYKRVCDPIRTSEHTNSDVFNRALKEGDGMNNYINNLFIKAIGGAPGELIQVQFYNRSDLIDYPASMIDLLKSDKQVRDILDPSTGEVLFTNDI